MLTISTWCLSVINSNNVFEVSQRWLRGAGTAELGGNNYFTYWAVSPIYLRNAGLRTVRVVGVVLVVVVVGFTSATQVHFGVGSRKPGQKNHLFFGYMNSLRSGILFNSASHFLLFHVSLMNSLWSGIKLASLHISPELNNHVCSVGL